MGKATEVLEHMEHVSHAGGHGHGDDHADHSKLGTYVGITMAVLGVLLAFCSAKVGGERTELVKALVEQQHAHAKYQAQDIKHRSAVNALRQLHSEIPTAGLDAALDADLKKIEDEANASAPKVEGFGASTSVSMKAARAVGRNVLEQLTPNKDDAAIMADTVDRYYGEAQAAGAWVETFGGAINAHVEAQEDYEIAQLLAEIGIVVASVALLMKRKPAWYVAILLGIGSIGVVGRTYSHTTHEIHAAEHKIEETGKAYRDLRTAGKMTGEDQGLADEVHKWSGKAAKKVSVPEAGKHDEHKPEGGEHKKEH